MKTVFIIAGPTAVGKTAVAIQVAQAFNTEIISADSRQCYRELNIGVARPSPEELKAVPHHFIASHSVTEKITAAYYETWALQKAHELFKKFDAVVLVGGTGLYLKAFCEGLDAMPPVPENIRARVQEEYARQGLPWLQQTVFEVDPLFAESGEIKNPHRLMRALEVFLATGKSIRSFQNAMPKHRPFEVKKLALDLLTPLLHQHINSRVDAMFANGLVAEVASLQPYRTLSALQTVGYKEVFQFLDGACSLADAVEAVKKNTRAYAKRQRTWFRKDAGFHWQPPDADKATQFFKSSY